MKILFVHQPLNNRGDESAHKGLLRALVKALPEVQIKVLFTYTYNDTIRQFDVQLPQVEYVCIPHRFGEGFFLKATVKYGLQDLWNCYPFTRKLLAEYRWADRVICAPGGICMGGFQDWMHLFFLRAAQSLNKPLAYYGRSFGPFPVETWSNRRFYKISQELLHYFSFCSIRDKKTERLAQAMKIPYVATVDSAFLDNPSVPVPDEIQQQIGDAPYVVFVPNLLIWHYAYQQYTRESVFALFAAFYRVIEQQYPNHKVVMLPQKFNCGNYLGDDYPFFCDLKKELGSERICVIPDTYSSDIQQSIIAQASCMIGARYHSVVFALNQNVPFVALSYEHKISGLLEALGKTDCMVDITQALESDAKRAEAVANFSRILPTVKPDPAARLRAKEIAQNCFNKYIQTLQ